MITSTSRQPSAILDRPSSRDPEEVGKFLTAMSIPWRTAHSKNKYIETYWTSDHIDHRAEVWEKDLRDLAFRYIEDHMIENISSLVRLWALASRDNLDLTGAVMKIAIEKNTSLH